MNDIKNMHYSVGLVFCGVAGGLGGYVGGWKGILAVLIAIVATNIIYWKE